MAGTRGAAATHEMDVFTRWVQLSAAFSAQPIVQRQYVSKVTSFSSEYGAGDNNWGAVNIIGPPRVYPQTGDNTKAWAAAANNAREFIVFEVQTPVIPNRFEIYETLAPGALVKITGETPDGWVDLWTGTPDLTKAGASRIFEPPITPSNYPIKTFRFDIDATTWTNWYEIDAVAITGDTGINAVAAQYAPPASRSLGGDLLKLLNSQTGDVTFETPSGSTTRAHSVILTARCPALLSHEAVVPVPDHIEVIRAVLQFLYADVAEITIPLSVPVHLAATRLKLDRLASMAAHVFSSVLFKENAIDILMFVDEMPELRAICMGFLSRNPSTLLATPGRAGERNPAALLSRDQLVSLVEIFAESKKAAQAAVVPAGAVAPAAAVVPAVVPAVPAVIPAVPVVVPDTVAATTTVAAVVPVPASTTPAAPPALPADEDGEWEDEEDGDE
eukprot:m.597111 g.597111  ORF g.597111 m.597111 type:complete len:445 (+) comp58061_c0_seq19:95-1429(+)